MNLHGSHWCPKSKLPKYSMNNFQFFCRGYYSRIRNLASFSERRGQARKPWFQQKHTIVEWHTLCTSVYASFVCMDKPHNIMGSLHPTLPQIPQYDRVTIWRLCNADSIILQDQCRNNYYGVKLVMSCSDFCYVWRAIATRASILLRHPWDILKCSCIE